jgi:hypothetical protein
MGRLDKQNARAEKLDPATWIPRREAARILNVSLPTILRWEGARFRITSTRDNAGRISWFVNADDVERARLERLGPTMAEIEAFVLSELAAGKTASAIVRAGKRVTLADVERIRDQDARLSGAMILDPITARELRRMFTVESMSAEVLLAHVAALRQRVDLLAARLNRASFEPLQEGSLQDSNRERATSATPDRVNAEALRPTVRWNRPRNRI